MSNSNLLKQRITDSPPAPPRVIKRSVLEAGREATEIISRAMRQAALTRDEAASDARELLAVTQRETREQCLAEWTDNLLAARGTRDAALAEVEREVLSLAVRIAEKIIGRELEQHPDAIADVIATAIRHARQHEILTVRINPADAPTVETHRTQLDATGRARFLDFVPDPRIKRGGCVIESESGTVDAELETQLRVIEKALLARTTN